MESDNEKIPSIILAIICLTNFNVVSVSAELSNELYVSDFIAENMELEYLARCVQAEAGNQDWMGKLMSVMLFLTEWIIISIIPMKNVLDR